MGKIFKWTYILFWVWFGLSYIEIICKNTSFNPQYSPYNLVIMILEFMLKLRNAI